MLSTYLIQTRELLKDTNSTYWTDASLTRYINLARVKIAEQYGCIRKLITGTAIVGSSAVPGTAYPGAATPDSTDTSFQTIANTERYAFSYATPYVRRFSGVDLVWDVNTIAVSWAGNSSQTGVLRPALDWLPFEDLQAYARSYNLGATSYPVVWSTMGDGSRQEVFLYPVPTQALEMEWDCFCRPKNIFSNDDYEALPSTFSDNVQYYAAYMAFLSMRLTGLADLQLQIFEKNCGVSRVNADRGKVGSYYWGR